MIGVFTDICVISNAMIIKAFLPETEILVDASCCAGVTVESHNNALEAMKCCQITIINQKDSIFLKYWVFFTVFKVDFRDYPLLYLHKKE